MGTLAGTVLPNWSNNVGEISSQTQSIEYQRAQAEADAASLEARAGQKESEAAATMALGRLAMEEHARDSRLEQAGTRVNYAASGVKVNEGTPVETIADKAAWSEYERQKIGYEASLASWGLRYDASILRSDAANTRQTSRIAASNSQSSSFVNQASTSKLFGWFLNN